PSLRGHTRDVPHRAAAVGRRTSSAAGGRDPRAPGDAPPLVEVHGLHQADAPARARGKGHVLAPGREHRARAGPGPDQRSLGRATLAVDEGADDRARPGAAADDLRVAAVAGLALDADAPGGDPVRLAADDELAEGHRDVRQALDLARTAHGDHVAAELAPGGDHHLAA